MKKGLKIINGFLGAIIILTSLPALSPADMIALQDGQSIEVEKVIEYEDNLIFYLHGLKMRVSKAAVRRIIKTDEVATAEVEENTSEYRNASDGIAAVEKTVEIDPLPAEIPSAGPPEKSRPEIRWCGFRNLRWASECSTLGQLQEIESANGPAEIKKYVRANEDLILGRVRLNSIVYVFWRHQLYAITLRTTGQVRYRALRKEIFNRFGVGLKSDQNRERYLWSDAYSDRILRYDDADQSALFWMGSKELNQRYQLSQSRAPSNCLKATETTAANSN